MFNFRFSYMKHPILQFIEFVHNILEISKLRVIIELVVINNFTLILNKRF